MQNSLDRFIAVFQMLCRELGEDIGTKLFKQILFTLGQGTRIRIPKMIYNRPHQASYYWDKVDMSNFLTLSNHYVNQFRFCKMKGLLFTALGDSTGAAIFYRIIIDLGPGHKLTVPFYKCDLDVCKCNRLCLWRDQRNETIKKEFRGINHEELGFKYNMHPRKIRRIVNE